MLAKLFRRLGNLLVPDYPSREGWVLFNGVPFPVTVEKRGAYVPPPAPMTPLPAGSPLWWCYELRRHVEPGKDLFDTKEDARAAAIAAAELRIAYWTSLREGLLGEPG